MTSELERRLARVEAVAEIQNVMSTYSFWHSANMHAECETLFALKTPGVRAEMMWGVYEGAEGIKRCYSGFHVMVDGDGVGKMHMHTLTTPVIRVAGDGKTARAVWVSPGHETGPDFKDPSRVTANWAWCKYGADFVLEDGAWKIWHLHVYGIFMADYYKSWVDAPDDMDTSEFPPLPDHAAPDRGPTTHWNYLPDRIYLNEPAPPAAYAAFDEANAF